MSVFKPDIIIKKLDEEIAKLKNQSVEQRVIAEKSIGLCQLALLELKESVIQSKPMSIIEEINIFKIIKPNVLSKLIFYNELFRLDTCKSLVSNKLMVKILNNEIRKIHEFKIRNNEFYQYYTTNQTHLDEIYFTRNKSSFLIGSKNFHHLTDPQFATPGDETISYIIAYEQLVKYLDNEIIILKGEWKLWQMGQSPKLKLAISWTTSKVALVELIYALHCCSCINNGRIQINELISFFETIFDVKLNETYRAFVDIKDRKKEKAKFLTELKSSLISKLDAIDELN